MFSTSIVAVASLLLSFLPLTEKLEYSIAEISIAKKASLVYSIGQLEIHGQGGAITPAKLLKTPDDHVVMLISEPLTLSSTDSIYFRRSMAIVSSGAKKVDEKSIVINRFESSYQSMEQNAKGGIKLHDTLFDKESKVQLITDIMYDNDTAILASLDTITVKRDRNGYLKAYTAPYRPNAVTVPVGKNFDPSRKVILRVWAQMLLPEKSKFSIVTRAQMKDKKPYNVVTTNSSMIVPGYTKKN